MAVAGLAAPSLHREWDSTQRTTSHRRKPVNLASMKVSISHMRNCSFTQRFEETKFHDSFHEETWGGAGIFFPSRTILVDNVSESSES